MPIYIQVGGPTFTEVSELAKAKELMLHRSNGYFKISKEAEGGESWHREYLIDSLTLEECQKFIDGHTVIKGA